MVQTNGGDDVVQGGPGRDYIRTGRMSPMNSSETDDDRAYGGEGDDLILGDAHSQISSTMESVSKSYPVHSPLAIREFRWKINGGADHQGGFEEISGTDKVSLPLPGMFQGWDWSVGETGNFALLQGFV